MARGFQNRMCLRPRCGLVGRLISLLTTRIALQPTTSVVAQWLHRKASALRQRTEDRFLGPLRCEGHAMQNRAFLACAGGGLARGVRSTLRTFLSEEFGMGVQPR